MPKALEAAAAVGGSVEAVTALEGGALVAGLATTQSE